MMGTKLERYANYCTEHVGDVERDNESLGMEYLARKTPIKRRTSFQMPWKMMR